MAQLQSENVVSELLTGAVYCAEGPGEDSPQYEINGLCYLLRSNCNNVDVGAPKERSDAGGLGDSAPSMK